MVYPNIPSPAAIAAAVAAAPASAPLPTPHPPRVEYLSTLSRHTSVVNVVRFCPRGETLATAGDGESSIRNQSRRVSLICPGLRRWLCHVLGAVARAPLHIRIQHRI